MNFNHTAWWYDALAGLVFAGHTWKAQIRFINLIPPGSKILIVGGGTGRILQELTYRNPGQLTYLEKSAKMLQKARKRKLQGSIPIHWIHGDEGDIPKSDTYDVVLTFYLFSNYNQPQAGHLWDKLNPYILPGGLWLFADFKGSVRQNRWQNWLSRIMTGFFRITAGVQVKKIPDRHLFIRSDFYREINYSEYFGGYIEALVLRKH
jgi:2-polyprenyl-3-methyl-5-hydroxy-6-metoxy-1,4-benzoquinol methylase